MRSGFQKLFGERPADDETVVIVEKGDSEDKLREPVESINVARIAVEAATDSDLDDIRDRVVRSLLQSDRVPRRVVRESLTEWRRTGQEEILWRVLARNPRVDREMVFAESARIYAFRVADVAEADGYDYEFGQRLLESFTDEQKDELLVARLLPLAYEFDEPRGALKLVFATHDPTNPDVLRFVHGLGLDNFEVRYAPQDKLFPIFERLFPKRNEFLDRIRQDVDASMFDMGATFEDGAQELVDQEALDAEINRSALINLFEAALVEAVRQQASDIHVYPNPKKQTEFHFRIDGELQLWNTQTKVSPEAMIAVVKDRCGNIDRFEREAAQDGYIQRTVDGALIRYRVSVLPIASQNRDIKAESIVIRVLDDRNVFSDLSKIGLLEGALERYKKAVSKPHGMVIMTGPTGSGKSTTLVAALHQVMRPQINVLTVEDPVEYIIPGVRQIKLGTRLELEWALRAILRHDPDVVMVGEMRDRPTAELAIKLANTGHLTFSTLHTNDAPSAISRLYKMGVEPFLIAYAINLVVAQRLLRKLCPDCRQVDDDPDPLLLKELGFSEQEIAEHVFYTPNLGSSCVTCKGIGYKGRRAIGEALYFTRRIRHIIVSSGEAVDEDAIRDAAIKEGMLTLLASAREVVKMGETSIEEVIRVTTSEE